MTHLFLRRQYGGTLLGFIIGLVVGLGVAVAVALYITNAPVPFVNKVRPASENINPGAGGQLPDPNKPLQMRRTLMWTSATMMKTRRASQRALSPCKLLLSGVPTPVNQHWLTRLSVKNDC